MSKIHLCDGKYIITHDNGNNLQALRHGQPWRDLVGDGLVLALVQRIEELQEQIMYYRDWEGSLGDRIYE